MILWFYVIFGLILIICLIGVRQKDYDYENMKKEVISATKKYMLEKNMDIDINSSMLVFVSDLVKAKYIKQEDIEDYCFDSVVYFNGLLEDEYKIYEECKDN